MRSLIAILKTTLSRVLLLDVLSDRSAWPAFAWAGIWVLIGTLVYHYLEGWAWLDALYFCVVTLATVGYGDFTPTTPVAKIFTLFYILNGIGILLFFIDKVVDVRKARGAERHSRLTRSAEDRQQT
jgi:voltage-gated potassium channel Kch